MADIFDQATEAEERARDAALLAQAERAKAAQALAGTGECQNPLCGEDFNGDMARLFCGAECAKQFQKYGKQ